MSGGLFRGDNERKKKEVEQVPALKNPRQEKYVQKLIEGMSQRKAYRAAFPASKKWKDSTVDSKASALLTGKVLERYNELQKKQEKKALLTRQEKREILAKVARNDFEDAVDRIRAINIDNKMEGEYTTKIDATVQPSEKFEDIIEQLGGVGLDE